MGAAAIRPAELVDDEPLAEVDRLTWSRSTSPGPRPPEGRPFFIRGLEPGNVLVAEVGGTVVGYVALGAPTRLASNSHVQEVHGLAVHPAHQGCGVGRQLLQAAADEARSRGARRLTLRVLASNDLARRVYQACGFAEEGILREEFLLDGRYVDDVLMALVL
jgi:ribosomal protein S18 acetylase RimI-like enzyme